MTKHNGPRIEQFTPVYARQDFLNFSTANWSRRPFHVLYVGRVERNKGVFDLLEVARLAQASNGDDTIFEFMGEGAALAELEKEIRESGLCASVFAHGACTRQGVLEGLERSHVVIVPTRTEFSEGLNKVVIEAVLAKRPVITSSVCKSSLDLVREAALEVVPDSAAAYWDALRTIKSERQVYEAMTYEAEKLQTRFFNRSNGWSAHAEKLILRSSASSE